MLTLLEAAEMAYETMPLCDCEPSESCRACDRRQLVRSTIDRTKALLALPPPTPEEQDRWVDCAGCGVSIVRGHSVPMLEDIMLPDGYPGGTFAGVKVCSQCLHKQQRMSTPMSLAKFKEFKP